MRTTFCPVGSSRFQLPWYATKASPSKAAGKPPLSGPHSLLDAREWLKKVMPSGAEWACIAMTAGWELLRHQPSRSLPM